MEALTNIATTPKSSFPTLLCRCFYAKAEDLNSVQIANILSRWRAVSHVYKAAQGTVSARATVMMLRGQGISGVGEGNIELACLIGDEHRKCTIPRGRGHNLIIGLARFYEKCIAIWLEMVVTELMGEANSF